MIFLFIFHTGAMAQEDSLSVFRNSSSSAIKSKEGNYKNALSFNLLQILRGGALISYERSIGSSGFAITTGIGINKFDALGQLYLRELSYYYNSGVEVVKQGTKIKPLFDFGFKYYTQQAMGGTYVQTAFTSISNTVNLEKFDNSNYLNLPANSTQLDYRSNEFKFLFGATNKNDHKFYMDFNLGLGYRFIQYENYLAKEVINQTNYYYTAMYNLEKNKNTNQTLWFFMSWKFGKRF